MDDRLEDMQFEIRRHMLHVEEMNNMNMMRHGMRMICTGIEMVNGRIKLLDLQGWASEVCSDINRYDPALSKLYRKYWRRSHSSSPEMEIAMRNLDAFGHDVRYMWTSGVVTPVRPRQLPLPYWFRECHAIVGMGDGGGETVRVRIVGTVGTVGTGNIGDSGTVRTLGTTVGTLGTVG